MSSEKSDDQALVSLSAEGGLCIIPLGGLGEIGMNCMVFEYDGQIMVVDCGVHFPEEGDYGIDLLVPSFAYLQAHSDRVVGVVITHGHEDHIGGIPYLLRDLNPPIYGPPLAMAMVAHKLREHGIHEHARLHDVSPGSTFTLGPFVVEPIHVNHSMPQTYSLAIRTPVGLVIHTGDFKVDHRPIDEDPIDLARFAALGEEGVLCLLSDSTNVETEGYTQSEGWVAERLNELVERAPGRVVVTLFASNLHRVQALLDSAHQHGRRVLLLGRSLLQNVEIGLQLGLLHLPDGALIIEPSEAAAFRHDQLMVLCSGSQGEPRSAMTRLAFDDNPHFSLLPGDYVIFSCRTVPGNERKVGRVVNHLHRRGAEVFDWSSHPVHASGHACREEQRLMINLVQPLFFVPVHGEYRHLVKHAALAEELDVSESFVIENGDVLTLWEGEAEVTGKVSAGRVLVDGKSVEDLPSVMLRDRRRLAQNGIVVAWVVVEAQPGAGVSGPRLLTTGAIGGEQEAAIVAEATREVLEALQALNAESRQVPGEVAETVRRAVRRVFARRLERKPVVVPVVHEL